MAIKRIEKKKLGINIFPTLLKMLGTIIVVGIALLVWFLYSWISSPMPNEWETEVTINPQYPTSYWTFESGGKCSRSWFDRFFGNSNVREDGGCFEWKTMTDWKNMNLEFIFPNGQIATKPSGRTLKSVLDYNPSAVTSIRTTDGSKQKLKVKFRCSCQDR